ncbi:MAG TPA: AI-2E family transporter [Streptosporangiaceae bacterium]|nr:AI-2E family transporter [Streptosporangiaceae bacterium]
MAAGPSEAGAAQAGAAGASAAGTGAPGGEAAPAAPDVSQPGPSAAPAPVPAAGRPGLLRSVARRVRSGLEAATSDSAVAPRPAPAIPVRPPAAADGAQPAPAQPAPAEPAADARTQAAAAQDDHVPRLLRITAAWAWRLILVAILIYGAFRVSEQLRLVVLPLIAALLLTALLQPVAAWLHRRAGFPHLLATWLTLLGAVIVIAGVVTLTANRVSADYPALAAEVKRTAGQVQHSLAGPPFHLHGARLQQFSNDVVSYISQHKGVIAGTVVTGGKIFLEFLTGLVLTLFITFFLIKDGAKIYSWLIGGLHAEPHRRMVNAGHAAWHVLTSYIRGTTVVAAIHAIFIGLALWLLGVPLLVPLIILVFLAGFIPLIGILVVGALAILITLGTKGWLAAVILLAVFVVENQIESHLLQPLVVGRAVRLHPLAIILALAVGGVIAGIPGAIVAVPVAAVITYAWPMLRGGGPPEPGSEPVSPPDG